MENVICENSIVLKIKINKHFKYKNNIKKLETQVVN